VPQRWYSALGWRNGWDMTYATGRVFLDADSHVMELPDFLDRHADAGIANRLPPVSTDTGGSQGEGVAVYGETRRHTPAQIATLERNVMAAKAYDALGAFDPGERTQAINLLGFQGQLVFGTFSVASFLHHGDHEVLYGGCRAFNRAIAEFCRNDDRLMAVGIVSLSDPIRALREIAYAVDLGCAAIWIPAEPCGGRSPGHTELEPVWALLSQTQVPFMLHVGAQPMQIRDDYMNTGRPVATGWAGGGEALRLKDFPTLHQSSEEFLSVLILDGVLDRHPLLKGGVIELGATWVPGMLRRLDSAFENLARHDPTVRGFARSPSEQIQDQLAFTPFPFDDVGALIRDSSDLLYLFSTDYPHIEGGRNPLGRFESSLAFASEATKERFYNGNFRKLFPI
jgi:predicted TIM-barrel fold metal-dependent hydrolase